MLDESNVKAFHAAFTGKNSSNLDDDDDDNEHDNDYDEDNTARLDRRNSLKAANENTLALQRVKSLTQRNRVVC